MEVLLIVVKRRASRYSSVLTAEVVERIVAAGMHSKPASPPGRPGGKAGTVLSARLEQPHHCQNRPHPPAGSSSSVPRSVPSATGLPLLPKVTVTVCRQTDPSA